MYDVSEDMPSSYRLTDKKINVKDFSKCTTVDADAVLDDVESSIKKVLRYYPDEDVPFEQAIVDLEDYLCLLYTSPSPRDLSTSRMPSSA